MINRKKAAILVLSSFTLSLLASCQDSKVVDVENKEFVEQVLVDFIKGEPNFSFHREKSVKSKSIGDYLRRMLP